MISAIIKSRHYMAGGISFLALSGDFKATMDIRRRYAMTDDGGDAQVVSE